MITMPSSCRKLLLSLVFFLLAVALFCQSPYNLKWPREIALTGSGGALFGLGLHLQDKTPLFTPDELITLDPEDINAFDRIATDFSSEKARKWSDRLLRPSFLLPVVFLAGKETREDIGTIAALFGENVLMTWGVTLVTKHAFRRPRPFVFDPDADIEGKQVSNAKASFVSGHTSATAANCYFMAKVYSDYYPDSGWKPVVWGVAATIPAITGFLRVRAGRHYPTDVIAGYVLGAAVGILVPQLHRIKAN